MHWWKTTNKLLADAKAIEAERDQLLTENKVLSEKFEHLQQKEWDRRNMLLKASWERVLKAYPAAADGSSPLSQKAAEISSKLAKSGSPIMESTDKYWLIYKMAAEQLGMKPAR
jgi:hypothetical protein